MEFVGNYLITVLATAIITAVISTITDGKGTQGAIIRMVCGVFLLLVMLGSASNIDFSDIFDLFDTFQLDAQYAVADGEALAQSTLRQSIITQTRAYILDKAQALGQTLDVQIELGDSNTPEAICVSGSVSPYAKTVLTKLFTDDLGVAKENITWLS